MVGRISWVKSLNDIWRPHDSFLATWWLKTQPSPFSRFGSPWDANSLPTAADLSWRTCSSSGCSCHSTPSIPVLGRPCEEVHLWDPILPLLCLVVLGRGLGERMEEVEDIHWYKMLPGGETQVPHSALSFCWSSCAPGGFVACGRARGVSMLGLLGAVISHPHHPPLLPSVLSLRSVLNAPDSPCKWGYLPSARGFLDSLRTPALSSELHTLPRARGSTGSRGWALKHSPWQFFPILLFPTTPASLHLYKSPDKKQARVSVNDILGPTNLRNVSSSPRNCATFSCFDGIIKMRLLPQPSKHPAWKREQHPALPAQKWLSYSFPLTPAEPPGGL